MDRDVYSEQNSFWSATNDIDTIDNGRTLEATQAIQLTRNIEVNWIERQLSDGEISDSTRVSNELKVLLACEFVRGHEAKLYERSRKSTNMRRHTHLKSVKSVATQESHVSVPLFFTLGIT